VVQNKPGLSFKCALQQQLEIAKK